MKSTCVLFLPLLAISITAAAQDHLLLSEICVRNNPQEFIEVYNPMSYSVSLENYYLTDLYGDEANHGEFYPYIVFGSILSQDVSDFLVRFPAGSQIQPGQALIVALRGNDFQTSYGYLPDFEIVSTGAVQQMAVPLNGFVGSSAGLSNGGETVTLFYWDSASDLVQDVDYASWSDDLVRRLDKSGISIDGPDPDTNETVYFNDTAVEYQDRISGGPHPAGESFTRVDFSEGSEIFTGGNGITGHDETSENMSLTWGFAESSPGDVVTALQRSTWGELKTIDLN